MGGRCALVVHSPQGVNKRVKGNCDNQVCEQLRPDKEIPWEEEEEEEEEAAMTTQYQVQSKMRTWVCDTQ